MEVIILELIHHLIPYPEVITHFERGIQFIHLGSLVEVEFGTEVEFMAIPVIPDIDANHGGEGGAL